VLSLIKIIVWCVLVASRFGTYHFIGLYRSVDFTTSRYSNPRASGTFLCKYKPKYRHQLHHSTLQDSWNECREVFGEGNVLIVSNSAGSQLDAGAIKVCCTQPQPSSLHHRPLYPTNSHFLSYRRNPYPTTFMSQSSDIIPQNHRTHASKAYERILILCDDVA
jgi:hypothetical protein